MLQHDWSSANLKGPMSHLSLSPCTGSRLQLASSSRHWCLHIKHPQTQHPPTSTHWWQSTSRPEAWDLRVSDASWCHHREAQNHFSECFHSPFLAGGMNFPPLSGMLSPWKCSSDSWKLISSIFTWLLLLLHKKKTFKVKVSLTSDCLASFALNSEMFEMGFKAQIYICNVGIYIYIYIYIYNIQLFTLKCVHWWAGVMWIIVMFLSAFYTLILTAPIYIYIYIYICIYTYIYIYIEWNKGLKKQDILKKKTAGRTSSN